MAVRSENPHYRIRDIEPRHWKRLADGCGDKVWQRMVAMADKVGSQLPEGFPRRIWTAISTGVERHAQLFLRGADAL